MYLMNTIATSPYFLSPFCLHRFIIVLRVTRGPRRGATAKDEYYYNVPLLPRGPTSL